MIVKLQYHVVCNICKGTVSHCNDCKGCILVYHLQRNGTTMYITFANERCNVVFDICKGSVLRLQRYSSLLYITFARNSATLHTPPAKEQCHFVPIAKVQCQVSYNCNGTMLRCNHCHDTIPRITWRQITIH